jgi:hypothetical protein
MNNSILTLSFIFISAFNSFGADLFYTDWVYRESIKTVILSMNGTEGTPAAIELGSAEQLHLQFDDLDASQKQLYYSFVHCNADWTPSGIMPTRAVQGLQQDLIQDFRYSFNTFIQYIHYDLVFPNDNMKFMISGNYILKVYEDNDPDNLVLTRRFMVYSKKVPVGANVRRPALMELRDTHQELDAVADISKMALINAPSATRFIMLQNQRWDNAITVKPFSLNQAQINYNHDDGSNCFEGLNEFRWADIRSLRMNSDRVRRINRDSTPVEVILMNDPMRSFSEYQLLAEANGRFFIRNNEGNEPELDADYAWVEFRLPMETPLKDKEVYLIGAFSDWTQKPEFKLSYKFTSKMYTARILLKQGIYNYLYEIRDTQSQKTERSVLEGSHFNTENDYTLLFYYRAYTNEFDELLGYQRVNSLGR